MNTAVRKIIAVCLAGTACLYASCGTSSSSNVKVKIIKEDLFDANRLIGGAYRYYQAGDTRKARELLSHCINNKMETGEAFLLMGKCFFAERDYVKASIAFKYAINNSPRRAEGYTSLALIALQQGNVRDGLYILREARPYAAGSAMYHYLNGALNLAMGSGYPATCAFLKAISINPGFVPAYNGLVECFEKTGNKALVEAVGPLFAELAGGKGSLSAILALAKKEYEKSLVLCAKSPDGAFLPFDVRKKTPVPTKKDCLSVGIDDLPSTLKSLAKKAYFKAAPGVELPSLRGDAIAEDNRGSESFRPRSNRPLGVPGEVDVAGRDFLRSSDAIIDLLERSQKGAAALADPFYKTKEERKKEPDMWREWQADNKAFVASLDQKVIKSLAKDNRQLSNDSWIDKMLDVAVGVGQAAEALQSGIDKMQQIQGKTGSGAGAQNCCGAMALIDQLGRLPAQETPGQAGKGGKWCQKMNEIQQRARGCADCPQSFKESSRQTFEANCH